MTPRPMTTTSAPSAFVTAHTVSAKEKFRHGEPGNGGCPIEAITRGGAQGSTAQRRRPSSCVFYHLSDGRQPTLDQRGTFLELRPVLEIGVFIECLVDQFEDPLDLLLQMLVVRRPATSRLGLNLGIAIMARMMLARHSLEPLPHAVYLLGTHTFRPRCWMTGWAKVTISP